MNSVYLTSQEREIFDALSADVREGWEVSEEKLTFADTPLKLRLRLELLRLHDPALIALRDHAKTMETKEEIAALLASHDLRLTPHADIAALFFALGSGVLTDLILLLLRDATTDTDVSDLASITFIRHEILASYLPA